MEDEAVPMENSVLFAMGLRKEGVPFELHIYTQGAHGLSLATRRPENICLKLQHGWFMRRMVK